jgi:hypothetical protein
MTETFSFRNHCKSRSVGVPARDEPAGFKSGGGTNARFGLGKALIAGAEWNRFKAETCLNIFFRRCLNENYD